MEEKIREQQKNEAQEKAHDLCNLLNEISEYDNEFAIYILESLQNNDI